MSKLMATLLGRQLNPTDAADSTVYTIQTSSHFYTGKIVFQDDKMMRVWVLNKMKTVKILKENILKISITDKSNQVQERTGQINWKSVVNPAL